MTKRYVVVLMVAVMISTCVFVNAEDIQPPKLLSSTAVEDLVGSDARFVSLSPDGKTISTLDTDQKQICLTMIAASTSTCSPFTDNFGRVGRYSYMSWSPDGRYIATTESFFDYFVDSDIWVFDTQSSKFTDRTDDDYFGNVMKMPTTAFADYLPTWNSVTNELYMFRTPAWMNGVSSGGPETDLYQLPIDKGDPQLLQKLAVRLPPLSVYRPVSISPDGKRMAFLVLPNDYLKNPASGVWVMDLSDMRFQQVTGYDDLQGGVPKGAADKKEMIPNSIAWAGDDSVVVTSLDMQMDGTSPENAYYVSVNDGKVTPLFDFSALQMSDLYKQPTNENDVPPRAIAPRDGIPTPDGSGYISLGTDMVGKSAYVWWTPLPPDGQDPILVGKIEDFKVSHAAGNSQPSISLDGKTALVYGYVMKLTSQ